MLVYGKKIENMSVALLGYNYDIIVNCILWDVERKDHIVYKENLTKLKKAV